MREGLQKQNTVKFELFQFRLSEAQFTGVTDGECVKQRQPLCLHVKQACSKVEAEEAGEGTEGVKVIQGKCQCDLEAVSGTGVHCCVMIHLGIC